MAESAFMQDKDLYRVLAGIQGVLGEVRADQKNHLAYLDAVSLNVKELKKEFNEHKNDDSIKMGTINSSLGRIEANQVNASKAVADTAKELSDHKEDNAAHGEKSRTQVWEMIGKVLAGVAALATLIFTVYKLLHP